ncbi:baseplate J/gp47 family protein [Shewanella sp. D64]|uniref:baseplate J/gp47 family protein n=1 Tax=unclassified Shewanella TaxID=196818 RepID=UPI0022BA44E9|nr:MULTISPECIES: baseplate J/gp47 family protein [unclassified Shewanella]MEC4728853.1 baseplate J/gp47 family protein [Shewanella sp. D64]MEC4740727.1 baseplate J/gp47 family protein [Shewanella sp. E94]WBJ95314.1 baseplate J/gp47 family protein [Shewanella sp. MTB7]
MAVDKPDFKKVLKNANIPTTEEAIRAVFDEEVIAQGGLINNDGKYSPFWRLVRGIISKPYLWLIDFLLQTILPQSFVKTATGFFLDLYLQSVKLTRKTQSHALGYVIFERERGAPELLLPAGFTISTDRINGIPYRLIVINDTRLAANIGMTKVDCRAEFPGSHYNLASGYYQIPQTPLPGLIRVYTPEEWLTTPGADDESNDDARERYRSQFASVSGWYIDDKYKGLMSLFGGVKTSQIYIEKNAPRGPGSANAYLLLDSGIPTQPFLDAINKSVRLDGYHGLGDDMLAMALPELNVTITCDVLPVINLTDDELSQLFHDIEQYIRGVFRENQAYPNAMLIWPLTLFSMSTLNQELRNHFPLIESLYFAERDFKLGLNIARLETLTLTNVRAAL